MILCFPRGNVVCIHSCDECKKSTWPIFCHKLCSTSWKLLPHSALTIKCLVCRCDPNKGISVQSASILLVILQHSLVLLFWIDDHQDREWRRCIIVRSICSLFRNVVRRMSLRVLSNVVAQPSNGFTVAAESKDSNIFSTVLHDPLVSFAFLVVCIPNRYVIQWKSRFFKFYVFFHIGIKCFFFPVNFLSSTCTERNKPLSRCMNRRFPLWYVLPIFFEWELVELSLQQ